MGDLTLPDGERMSDILAEFNEAIEELHRETREQLKELERSSQRNAEFDARREEAARRGELGPQWLRLQQRIDLGQTSLQDVWSGRDQTPEADFIRETTAKNLVTVTEAAQVQFDDETSGAAQARRETDAIWEDIDRRIQAITRELNSD